MTSGLFVGLCTLDVIQLVTRVPGGNEKLAALKQVVAAGGPATNAAVAFAHLGGEPTLLTGVGTHPLGDAIRADLASHGVHLIDLAADSAQPPPVSSIMVSAGSGERAVVSTNAAGRTLPVPSDLPDASVVELDAHHPDLALAAAAAGRLTVLDGGSWKPVTPSLVPLVDVVVCSADFHPPESADPLDFLHDNGVRFAAVTAGATPIRWRAGDLAGELPVPTGPVLDTLGAGDFFHGALAHSLASAPELNATTFVDALTLAAEVATRSCRSFGTREWLRR